MTRMIVLRAKAQDRRYRSAVAVLLIALGMLVIWEHSAGGEHNHVDEAISMCVAVLSGVVAVLGLGALPHRPSWPKPAQEPRVGGLSPRPHPQPYSRAGPTEYQVLLR